MAKSADVVANKVTIAWTRELDTSRTFEILRISLINNTNELESRLVICEWISIKPELSSATIVKYSANISKAAE